MKLALMMILALTSASFAAGPKTGKLTGHLEVGPLSPLERPGVKPNVPAEVYGRYGISITQPGPHNEHMRSHVLRVVATLKLSARGDFSIDLPPGEYRVDVTSKEALLRRPESQTVNLQAGKTYKVNLKVDTGIR